MKTARFGETLGNAINFTDRCAIAAACLPRDEYRAKLEALHAEMLGALAQTGAEPVAWRITDGEGGYNYYDDEPELFNVDWAARYGRKHEPLYAAPTAQPAPPDVMGLPFSEAKARILAMPADDAKSMAISMMIQLSIAEKYAAPQPAREPLTDEQIEAIWKAHVLPGFGERQKFYSPIIYARAIEAAHGIAATKGKP